MNFLNELIKSCEKNSLSKTNRTFTPIRVLDVLRVDAYFETLENSKKMNVNFRSSFNAFIDTDTRIKVLEKLQKEITKHIKEFKEVKKNE